MNLPPAAILESCFPLSDQWHDRAVKREAVRKVVLERKSYRAAARETNTTVPAVTRWCDEFEERLRHAREWAQQQSGVGGAA